MKGFRNIQRTKEEKAMIWNINSLNATKIYPDVKTYIEEKSIIDIESLTKEIFDRVEISENAKVASQTQQEKDYLSSSYSVKPNEGVKENPGNQDSGDAAIYVTAVVPMETVDTYH